MRTASTSLAAATSGTEKAMNVLGAARRIALRESGLPGVEAYLHGVDAGFLGRRGFLGGEGEGLHEHGGGPCHPADP